MVLAGLQVIRFLRTYKFSASDVDYLRSCKGLEGCDPAFFDYLAALDCSKVVVTSLKEGTVCFPRISLLAITGPLIIGQLLETVSSSTR